MLAHPILLRDVLFECVHSPTDEQASFETLMENDPPRKSSVGRCPRCGEMGFLYQTPDGLRCEKCIKKANSGGLYYGRHESPAVRSRILTTLT